MLRRLAAVCFALLCAAGCGSSAGPPRLVVGVVENRAKTGDAAAETRLIADSGFRAVVLSSLWTRGERTPAPAELAGLRVATAAAARRGVRPIVAVYQLSPQTPASPADRVEFAAYAASLVRLLPHVHDLIVGNEPNLNRFWLPQFDTAGGDAAARTFERLLAATYDMVKSARPDVQLIGAGLSPHGSDNPAASRPTHSPTQFLLDLGAAYRSSHRDRPIMDALSLHPYGEFGVPPSFTHPRTTAVGIADYGKLLRVLGRAFGGTAQRARSLPIVYGEYGVETTIPPAKASLYSGSEVVPTVDEATQARYYREAIGLAACEPTVELLLLFHLEDEPLLSGLQSGVRYADGTPKSSERPVARAAGHPRCSTP